MRLARIVTTLAASGSALLAAAIAFSHGAAHAATGSLREEAAAYRYTDKPFAAAMTSSRVYAVYVDQAFDAAERERVALALRQWNHVLNGFVQLRPLLLPSNASDRTLAQLRRSGGWIVLKVDNRHPAARDAAALAVTAGGRGGGFVYVIADRFAMRDLTAVMLHEVGHVLGAGHDPGGHLMAPFYDRSNGHCIDRGAVAMVASAQRLPLGQLNWCVGPGL